jgi:hypothetical protein
MVIRSGQMAQRLEALFFKKRGFLNLPKGYLKDIQQGYRSWGFVTSLGQLTCRERPHIPAMCRPVKAQEPRSCRDRDSSSLTTWSDLQSFRAHARLLERRIPTDWYPYHVHDVYAAGGIHHMPSVSSPLFLLRHHVLPVHSPVKTHSFSIVDKGGKHRHRRWYAMLLSTGIGKPQWSASDQHVSCFYSGRRPRLP